RDLMRLHAELFGEAANHVGHHRHVLNGVVLDRALRHRSEPGLNHLEARAALPDLEKLDCARADVKRKEICRSPAEDASEDAAHPPEQPGALPCSVASHSTPPPTVLLSIWRDRTVAGRPLARRTTTMFWRSQ